VAGAGHTTRGKSLRVREYRTSKMKSLNAASTRRSTENGNRRLNDMDQYAAFRCNFPGRANA